MNELPSSSLKASERSAAADSPQPAQPISAGVALADGKQAAKRQSLHSGYSLLARGEPQIWLTGGMLAICLIMIVGLLALILYAGLPTFWPRPVHWLVLNDGSMEIGQPQGTQVGPNESARPSDMPSGALEEYINRYYRTGNFDVTGQHYRWLAPWDLNSKADMVPKWGMVVERIENGRLYGLLGELSIAPEIAESAEEELFSLRLSKEFLAGISAEETSELVSQLSEAVDMRISLVRSRARREALESWNQAEATTSADAFQKQVKLGGDEKWQAFAAINADAAVEEVRVLFTEPSNALPQLQVEVHRAGDLRNQAESLQYAISRMDGRVSELRAAVRLAEIRTESSLPQAVETSHFLLQQIESLATAKLNLEQNVEALRKITANSTLGVASEQLVEAYRSQYLPEQLAALEQQLSEWWTVNEQLPPSVIRAVEAYQSGFRKIFADKIPLQIELAKLEEQLERAQIGFLLPSAPTEIGLSSDEMELLRSGKIGPEALEKLQAQAVDVNQESLEPDQLGDYLTFVSFLDSQLNHHALAIADVGYLTGSSVTGRKAYLLNEKVVDCEGIVRAIPVNQLSLAGKMEVYISRWREFLFDKPREANTEGGVFPAIWGTIVMTLIMTIAVVPFGVMAALYLREYTKSGPLVSIIRISINNLAGVPSIVYGVFGFSFFCYTMGAFIDGGPRNAGIQPWPSNVWYLVLAGLAMLGTAAFFFSFVGARPRYSQSVASRWAAGSSMFLWLACVAGIAVLIFRSPFFDGFYQEYLPNPTFGKGGLLWAALTLSLLTLPVVIVATEEALAAVPNSLREGSLACGASKWQTIYRIILPHARPGILTGAILAMARGAGEVAPLMLVGALATAPDLPLDTEFPFFHGSRSFMHLGYQIYTLGFQSQNSEAAKPMVFTCTLLLILIVAALNISAIYLRARLKRQFQGNQF